MGKRNTALIILSYILIFLTEANMLSLMIVSLCNHGELLLQGGAVISLGATPALPLSQFG
jgi:hypothetical protein